MSETSRRGFIKRNLASGIGLALGTTSKGMQAKASRKKEVRVGIVGTGKRGRVLLQNLMQIEGVEIPAICDIDIRAAEAAKKIITRTGQKQPQLYTKDEYAWKSLMDRDDLAAVIIATPWRWHAPMSVYAMKKGKYAGVEVPAAQTVEECWELVNTSEETQVPCMMLENANLLHHTLSLLNMIRDGLLGELSHCYCAHCHDCIDHWFFDAKTGEDLWPAKYLINRNRDQYPTHQIGPVMAWFDIGCGDNFEYITSTASDSRAINAYFARKFGNDHLGAERAYKQGDIVTNVIRTKKGRTIIAVYDLQLPRPYDDYWMVQGTGGIYDSPRNSIYMVDKSPKYHQWESFDPHEHRYEHQWWKDLKTKEVGSFGHGGEDYLTLEIFIEAVREKKQTPIDVYDSVIMSVIGPLSEESITKGSTPVKVPDFTRGKWETRKPSFGI